jgi:hypothetical protein
MPPKKKTKSRVNEAGNYTKPTMRKNLFNKIKAGSKGGKPGQWSARKAQMLAKAVQSQRRRVQIMYFGLDEMLRMIKEWFIKDSKPQTKPKRKRRSVKPKKVAKKP